MHREREATYFRDISAEMEGSITFLTCCIFPTANGHLTGIACNLKDAQPKYGRAFSISTSSLASSKVTNTSVTGRWTYWYATFTLGRRLSDPLHAVDPHTGWQYVVAYWDPPHPRRDSKHEGNRIERSVMIYYFFPFYLPNCDSGSTGLLGPLINTSAWCSHVIAPTLHVLALILHALLHTLTRNSQRTTYTYIFASRT